MKRKNGNRMPGLYIQDRIENEYFNGYLCYTKLDNIDEPLVVNNSLYDLCIIKNNYEWYQLFSLDRNYVLTIMIDENKNVIQWYFDISYKIGLDNGVPYEMDMYLDLIITKEGNIIKMDEEELIDAYNKGELTKEDLDNAYDIYNYLVDKYYNNLDELKELTNYLINKYSRN